MPWFAGSAGPDNWAKAKSVFLKLQGRIPGMLKEMDKVEAEVNRKEELRMRDRDKLAFYLARRPLP